MFKIDVNGLRKQISNLPRILLEAIQKGLVTPAGKAFPTPKGYDQDSPYTEEIIPEKEWSEGMKFVAHLSKTIATNLLGVEIGVKMSLAGYGFRGCYGHRVITFNVTVLGEEWFEQGLCEEIIELILHELAHEYESNHLSENYTRSVCKLAARAIIQTVLSTADFTP